VRWYFLPQYPWEFEIDVAWDDFSAVPEPSDALAQGGGISSP
jgi:hypothetical protein